MTDRNRGPIAKRGAVELQTDIFRRMAAGDKLALALELRRTNLELLASGIRDRMGAVSKDRMRIEVLRSILPPRLFQEVYGHHDG